MRTNLIDAASVVRTHSPAPPLVPTPHDPRPGRFIRHLDFNHFRTIGMRRLVDEGVNNRFVTGDRLQSILKVCLTTPLINYLIRRR